MLDTLSLEEQEIIYNHYNVELFKVISSPLREDNNPSFSTKIKNDKIIWSDFAQGNLGMSVFDFISRIEKCDFKKSLEIAGSILKSNRFSNSTKFEKINSTKVNNLNVLTSTKWHDFELEYWNKRGVTENQLILSKVYPLRILKNNDAFISTSVENSPRFIYDFGINFGESFKVYSPYDGKYKWLSKNINYIAFETPLTYKHKTLIILSSKKDNLVFDNFNINVDTTSVLSECNFKEVLNRLDNILLRYDNIYSLFDFDYAGEALAYELFKQSNFKIKPINIGNLLNYLYYINVKDIDELKIHGDLELEKILINEIRKEIL